MSLLTVYCQVSKSILLLVTCFGQIVLPHNSVALSIGMSVQPDNRRQTLIAKQKQLVGSLTVNCSISERCPSKV